MAADFEYFRYEEEEDDRDHWTQTRHWNEEKSSGRSKTALGKTGTSK
ncbi:MAG: hypothetical protein U5K84_10345 [Alkalibacterium sp.]|nr:hypothetical protein [Alkalibacterium sp.]